MKRKCLNVFYYLVAEDLDLTVAPMEDGDYVSRIIVSIDLHVKW